MKRDFWVGKKVFLTGHTGFKGSWLSLWLQSLGAEVTGFALRPPTKPSLFEIANVSKGMHSVIGDVRDYSSLHAALSRSRAEIVIHMAAQPLVLESYRNPIETYSTNVMGTVHLLESVRLLSHVRAVVNVTSDKCYENREWIWGYRENEEMGGHDPYSSSKGCAELVTRAYIKSYFSDLSQRSPAIASARAGNVIGGGDWAENRLIPDFFRSIDSGGEVIIRNPDAVRPWQHVLEPLSGYLMLAQALLEQGARYSEGWNFGPSESDSATVGNVTAKFASLWGGGFKFQIDRGAAQRHEAGYLKLDCSKAHSILGWYPRWNLTQSLASVVEWHKLLQQPSNNMREFTLDQVRQYSEATLHSDE